MPYVIKQSTIFHYAKRFMPTILSIHQKKSPVSPKLSAGKSANIFFVKNIKRLARFIVFR